MPKTDVYLLFGGRSGEHEVSVLSARNVLAAMDPNKYNVNCIGITREGRWLLLPQPQQALTEGLERAGGHPVTLAGDPTACSLLPIGQADERLPAMAGAGMPVFFPVLHGPFGEDGTVQGLLELAGVPYVGCGVLASAVGMDKAVARALFRQAGLPMTAGLVVLRRRWEAEPAAVRRQIEQTLGYPCFVKPCNLGSSVGISKVVGGGELDAAIDLACRYDRKVLVEQAVDAREIECSVLGNDDPIASLPGEIVPGADFYSYEAKYLDDTSELIIPADLGPELGRQVQEMAVRAFQAIDGSGMARVDFFLERGSDRLLINEVNTIPGFTRISMYPKLWEASGIGYSELIDRLIALALERHADRQRMSTVR